MSEHLSALSLFLKRLEQRSSLSQDERHAVLELPGVASRIRAHHDIVSLGQDVKDACLVVDGLVGRYIQTSNGGRQVTALYIQGDMPDLHSVVVTKSASAFQALATSTILRVPHVSLAAAAARYPALWQAFWRDCSVDAIVAAEWIANIGLRTGRARIAHLICEMEQRYTRIGRVRDHVFELPITQAQLAEITGLTGVHVNRMLQALKRDGILTFERQTVTILNPAALLHLGGFDGQYLQLDMPPGRITA